MTLSVVLPCKNEEANIERTVRDVIGWFHRAGIDGEVIVVDDGSEDRSRAILERLQRELPKLRIVRHERNEGYGDAVRDGCDAARAEFIAFMDSDGQFCAEDFSLLLPHLERYPFVTGRRRKRADPLLRKVNAKLFGILTLLVLGIWVRDINCAMKVFRRSLWPLIRPRVTTGALFNAEVFSNLKRSHVPWYQVSVHHYPRRYGVQTGSNLSVILRMFRELFALKRAASSRSPRR